MDKVKFTLTSNHIKLLRRLCIDWNDEYHLGVPTVDSKRPYASKYVLDDIAEIVGIGGKNADGELILTPEQLEYCLKLHREMAAVLQLTCELGFLELGNYSKDEWRMYTWEKV